MCTGAPTVIVFLRSAWRSFRWRWKKLHAYYPGLAQGVEPKANLAELSSAVRLRRSFLRGKPDCRCTSIFCARLVAQYWEKRLAEVCEVEQDIAVGHQLRKNLDGMRHLTRDAAMPGQCVCFFFRCL
ncbi:hypothetical protein TcBrA4_0117430 [Trypanosoma cruzi]|nr:hypothetical protein TcBrA4_0117430 [Trypanosoma cruzi]